MLRLNKRLSSLLLALVLVLSITTVAFAKDFDLINKNTLARNEFFKLLDDMDFFSDVLDNSNQYVIEVDGKYYEVEQVDAATKDGVGIEDAVKDLEPVDLEDIDEDELEVVDVSAINAKGLKVVFNRPITKEEAAKDLKVEIKRGNVPVNVKDVEFTKDLKALEIELVTKLRKGTYTVAVKGLTDEALTGSVEVEDEKVAKIELGDKAALTKDDATKATVAYKVLNQYGEDITKNVSDLTVNAVGATIGEDAVDRAKGLITLTKSEGFKLGDKVRVTIVHNGTGTVATKEVVISEAATIDSIEFVGIYNKDDKELNHKTINSDEFYILVEAKDQYGNKLSKEDLTNINDDVVIASTNPTVAKVANDKFTTVTVDGKDKLALKLTADTPNKAGDATIRIVTTITGKTFEYKVTVAEAAELAEFILSEPEGLVVEGEEIEIPFTALDQFGNEITKCDDLKDKVTFSVSPKEVGGKNVIDGEDIDLAKDPVTKKAVLKITPNTGLGIEEGKTLRVVLTATVNETFKQSRITLEINPKAQPVTVGGLKDVATSVSPDATLEIKAKNVKVFDQYGREMKLDSDFFKDYNIKIDYTDTDEADRAVKIVDNNNSITETDTIKLEGVKKGSEEFKLFLAGSGSDGKQIASTEEYVFTVECVDKTAIEEYEVADIDPILVTVKEETEKTEKTLELSQPKIKVYGIKADGSKVLIGKNYYTINTNSELVTYDGKNFVEGEKLTAELDDKDEITLTLTFVISADGEPVTLTKDVVVKYADNKIAEIEFNDENKAIVEDGVAKLTAETETKTETKIGDISYDAINNLFVYKDQYGEKMDAKPAISITNFVGLDGKEFNGAKTVNDGDSFNIVQDKLVAEFNATVATDKASETVKVVVENAEDIAQQAIEEIKEEAKKHVDLDLSKETITIKSEAENTQLKTFVTEKNLNLAIAAGITEVKCDGKTIKINKNTDLAKVNEILGNSNLGDLAEKGPVTVTIGGKELTLNIAKEEPETK